jgi:hypothetical protein
VEALIATYDAGQNGPEYLNILLNAQRSLAQSESDYFRAVTNYAKAISQVHLRKGSLLEYNGVYLTEGPWPAKAYFDARRRARSRSAALYLDYGFTYPKVLSQGPTQQFSGQPMNAEEMPATAPGGTPAARPQELPVPAPGMNPPLRPVAPPHPVNPNTTAAAGRETHDLALQGWGSLPANADATASAPDPAVRPAGYNDVYELGKGLSNKP